MTSIAIHPTLLQEQITTLLGNLIESVHTRLDEVTVTVHHTKYKALMQGLRDTKGLQFDLLADLCGVDYSTYGDGIWEGSRYCVVTHLLSIALNQRVRVKVFCPNDDQPLVASVTHLWDCADWFEREAFDLFGIIFEGHHDLRRILTDYGFIGHPFRKDFPISGHVEMRYDAALERVVYEPVSIEPREITPRIIRENHYGQTTAPKQ